MKIGPLSVSATSEEVQETPEEKLKNSRWCETCRVRHPKPYTNHGIVEKYEEWCIRVGHKPPSKLAGIDTSAYDIDNDGFVIRKTRKKGV